MMDANVFYFTILFVVIYWICKKFNEKEDYLKAQGIAHPKPWPLVGSLFSVMIFRQSFSAFIEETYKKFSQHKVFGFYSVFGTYTIMVSDPRLIKQILVKDFDHFVNREPAEHSFDTDKLLNKAVIELRDEKWKSMRATLSPIYTTSKLKIMYGLLVDCANDFVNFYEMKASEAGGSVEIETHDVFARLTCDSIASTALGFQGDCVRNEKSEIYKIADAMENDFNSPLTGLLVNTAPGLFKLFGIQILRKSVHEFFELNVLNEMKRRRKEKINRSDVIQMLIQAQDGNLKIEEGDEVDASYVNTKIKKLSKWSDEELVAQAAVLFLGGFETTASLMQVVSFELAKNPLIQQKLAAEVDDILASLDGESVSYEKLNQMKYLEMVISETLRLWPSFRITPRYCEKDCVLKTDDGRMFTIKNGTDITFPIGAIHRDPNLFFNPEEFDPERFSDENRKKIPSGAYLPFGLGPRSCPGSRYALLEAKLLLFSIIAKFKIETCDRTPTKLTFSNGVLGYNETIYVALRLRN